jgi:hypothetical protein
MRDWTGQRTMTNEDLTTSFRYKNLTYFANLQKWPEGALENCQELAIKYADYHVTYDMEGHGPPEGGPEGYYACYIANGGAAPWMHAVTQTGIIALIDADTAKRKVAYEKWRAQLRKDMKRDK